MTSIASVNNAALQILQQTSPSNSSMQASGNETDILKIANGVSSEPSEGKKSAAAVIGKFAVDTAPTTGKIVVAGLGSADSWDEMKELVNNNDDFSDADKKEWLSKLQDLQEAVSSVEAFKASDLYNSKTSGAIAEQVKAFSADAEAASARNAKTIDSMNDLLVSQGRNKLQMTA